ncbi:MAG TPA: DUF2059 domain-containing protein [Rhizomicrobium sp.]|jgi:hypothetical protein|nr:DUF2059 domain-containing protein [Rhizomicrobium sp.]
MQFTFFPAGQKTTLAAAFAALFALAPAVQAQTMASPSPAQKPAAAPAAAAPAADADTASTDDPAKVAAAREFIMAYRPRLNPAFVSAEMDKVREQVADNLKKQDPKADVKAIMEKQRAEVMARIERQLDDQSHLVSHHFTMQELKDLTAFFSHGAGKKLIDETPKIQMEMMRRHVVARGLPGSGNPGAMTGKMVVGPDKSDSKPAPKPPGK